MSLPTPPEGYALRMMTEDDLDAVIAIERDSYEFPWTKTIFRDCLRVGYVGRVLEKNGELVGYGVLSHGAGEAHVLNVCVRRDLRGHGLGELLMRVLIDDARTLEADTVFLEVRPSNIEAIALYEKLGFNEIGERKHYYPAKHGREDARVFALTLCRPDEADA